jgi:hypothetical protein
VTIAVCATHDGAPLLPGDIRFRIEHQLTYGRSTSAEVASESPAPGSFLVRYTIPEQGHSDTFWLLADSFGTSDNHITQVDLDFFNVVYHEFGRNGSRVDFELLVSDRAGAPVNGSGVTLRLNPWQSRTGSVALDLGKTDKKGRVKGLFDLGPGVGELSIDGWANTSKRSQRFYSDVKLNNATRPYAYQRDSFFIERLGSEGVFLPGGTAVLTSRATYHGEPVRLQMLDCYLQTYRGKSPGGVPAGARGLRVVTDNEGQFALNLSFPAGYESYTTITAVGPGNPYSADFETYTDPDTVQVPPANANAPSDSWANSTFSAAGAGRAVKICATAPPGELAAAWAVWDFRYNETDPSRPWAVWSTFTWYLQAQPSGTNPLQGQLVLPRHLKSGQNLTVNLGLLNASGQHSSAGFPLRVRQTPVAQPEADLCCITSIFIVNALLIALLFFNYMAGRRTVRKKELEQLGADGQIEAVLGASRAAPRDLSLPIKVELAQSEDCTACGRKIAQGNLAWRCVCGARYHEHCAGGGQKCPSCGREWKKG